jgi:hypothetical protein
LLFNFPSAISGGEENIIRIFAPFLQIKLHEIEADRFLGFMGLLRGEDLSEYKIRIEHTRAEANQDLTDRLQE